MRTRLAALVVTAVVAAACGGGPATAPPPPDGVAIGGEVTVALPRPQSLDPGNVLDRTGEIVVRTMCDPLLEIDRETGEYRSALLDSWVITDGGTRMVLRLRRGLTFWDGSPVTSRDAVFGMSRAASADFAGANAGALAGIKGADVLGGFAEALEPRHRTEFAGIRILSDVAFEVTLTAFAPIVLPAMTNPVASPLSKVAAEADPEAFEATPVCIGPYRPAEPFDPDADTFTLERVPTYPGVNEAFTGGGQGYVERITFHWTEPRQPEDPTPPASPDPGSFDIVELDPTGRLQALSDDDVELVTAPSPSMQYLGLPPGSFPVEVRRALSQALDRRVLADLALRHTVAPATGFLVPAVGSRVYEPEACGPDVPERGDPDLARRTMEDSGVDVRGQRFELVTNPDFDNLRLLQEVARQWEQVFDGLDVRVVSQPWEEFRLQFDNPDGFSRPFRTSHSVPYAAPDLWLRIFTSRQIGNRNAVAYSNFDFDRTMDLFAPEAIDPVDQAIVHRDAEQMLCRDLPMLPLVMDQRHFAVSTDLASATGDLADLADPVTGGIRLRELWRP